MISIAMPTYNGEKYLAEQIDSILNQSIVDFELVISDDCSTDGTWLILEQYAQRDNRIRIFRNDKNLGYIKNYEKVLSLTNGEYIAMSDQDDVWSIDHLEILYNNLGTKVLCCGNVSLVREDGSETGRTWGDMYLSNVMPNDDLEKLMSIIFMRGCYQGASMLFKRSLLDKMLPFPENIKYHDLWISCVACLYGGINYVHKSIGKYRIHGNNLSGNHDNSHSRWKFFKSMCRWGMNPDRIHYILGLKSLPLKDRRQIQIIFFMEKAYNRKRKIWGHFLNMIFVFKNLRTIYCI